MRHIFSVEAKKKLWRPFREPDGASRTGGSGGPRTHLGTAAFSFLDEATGPPPGGPRTMSQRGQRRWKA